MKKKIHLEKRVIQPESNHSGLWVNDGESARLRFLPNLIPHVTIGAGHDVKACALPFHLKDHRMVLLCHDEQTVLLCTRGSKKFHDLIRCNVKEGT